MKMAVRAAESVDDGDAVIVAPSVASRGGQAANGTGRTV